MVTLKEVWPAAGVMGTVTPIPFSVVPFFFASCLALSMADWTELLSTAALPFLSGCMGLVSPVTGASGWLVLSLLPEPLEPPEEEPPPLPEPPEEEPPSLEDCLETVNVPET